MNADDLVWFVPDSGIRGLWGWGWGGGSKMNPCTSSPSFSPLRRRLRPGQRQHHPRAPSVFFFFFFSTPGIHDPRTICGLKWKTQLSGNKKAKPTTNGRAPLQGRKTRGCLGRRTAFWRFPSSAQPAVGPQRPLGPYSKEAGPIYPAL